MRVLHVDDFDPTRKEVREFLQQRAFPGGHVQVDTATSCDEALETLEGDNKPDVVILDLFWTAADQRKALQPRRLEAFKVIVRAREARIPCIVFSSADRLPEFETPEAKQRFVRKLGGAAFVGKEEYHNTKGAALAKAVIRALFENVVALSETYIAQLVAGEN